MYASHTAKHLTHLLTDGGVMVPHYGEYDGGSKLSRIAQCYEELHPTVVYNTAIECDHYITYRQNCPYHAACDYVV